MLVTELKMFLVNEMRGQISVQKAKSNDPPKTFTFDTVFGPDSKQVDVYNLTARPIVDSVLEGYNGMFTYFTSMANRQCDITVCNTYNFVKQLHKFNWNCCFNFTF